VFKRNRASVRMKAQEMEITVNVPWYQASAAMEFRVGILTREDGTDTFSRNVGKQLPHDAV
jgi:hypothetical protein